MGGLAPTRRTGVEGLALTRRTGGRGLALPRRTGGGATEANGWGEGGWR